MNAVRPPIVLPGRGTLLRALEHALDGEREAQEFLRAVLSDAGMDGVPESREAFEAFVREEVLPRLMPIARLDRVHDLVRRTIGEEGSLHPPPLRPHGSVPGQRSKTPTRPRVVLVEADSFRRIAYSRELVRAGFDVEVVASPDDVLELEAFHVLVLQLDDKSEELLRRLVGRRTRAGLVTWDDPARRSAVKRVIDEWPSDRVAIVARDAPPSALVARVRVVIA